MAKTYTAAGSATAGQVYTATAHNVIVTDVNNFIVPPSVRAPLANAQSIANATDTGLAFTGATAVDIVVTNGSTSSTMANAGKLTVDTAGLYLVTYMLTWTANAGGARLAQIGVDGTNSAFNANGSFWTAVTPSGSVQAVHSGGGILSLNAGQYIQVGVYQNSGGSLNAAMVGGSSFVHMIWVGRTS